jgi:uncharacterized membrane protein
MRFVLAIVGALLGAGFAGPGNQVFDVLIGGLAGFAVGELSVLRSRLAALDREITRLRSALGRERGTQAFAPAPAAAVAPASAVAAESPPAEARESAAAAAPLRDERPWRDVDAPDPMVNPPGPVDSEGLSGAASAPPPPWAPLAAAFRHFVAGGNTLVRIGVVVLFFGVAFLLRYLAEHTHIPIEFRLSGIALGSLSLLAFGWHLRQSRPGYALAIQGGGVGILYLTVFSALRLYALLSPAVAFPVLALVAVLSATLAVLQNSLSFALLGITGGFLAPVLASTGQGSHVVLFSYYAVLNAGILLVSWFKAWRPLNIAGFLFTFAIGTAWGVLKYRPEDFSTTEPFLAAFFLFYLGIAVLFTLRQPAKLTGYIDATLIFGTPIAAFALQAAMLRGRPMALAYSAVALSAAYLAAAWLLKRRRDGQQSLMIEAFIALAVVFFTLAVPLALDARWNAATWALEGAAAVWAGCRQQRPLARAAGILLLIASGGILSQQFDLSGSRLTLSLDGYLGVLTESAAAVFVARTLYVHRDRLREFERDLPEVAFGWGLLWWAAGGLAVIARYVADVPYAASLSFVTLTALLCSAIHRRVPLTAAQVAALLQLPAMVLFLTAAGMSGSGPPLANGGWWAWPSAFAGLYWVMYRHEGPAGAPLANLLNSVSSWLLAAVVSWEAAWAIDRSMGGGQSWRFAAWALFPLLWLYLLPALLARVQWPFARNREAYLFIAGVGMAIYLALWSLGSDLAGRGDSAPLPYWPVLNPLDLGEAFTLIVLFRYWHFLKNVPPAEFARIDARVPVPVLSALAFLWLNAVLLRTLHEWFAMPLGVRGILESTLAQTALSIFWAALALATMVFATRTRQRGSWLAGAALLGLTVAKLFVVDLSSIGSIERIVSFLGVGMLLLIVGYFSPIPPAPRTAS